jgi:hypothetical protein
MLYLANRLARMESEADRREFVAGLVGSDKVNLKSLAVGFVSTSLLLKAFKK